MSQSSQSDLFDLMTRASCEHTEEGDALLDLWSWLPSAHFAREVFGDYAADVTFNRTDTIKEATMVLSQLAGGSRGLTAEAVGEWLHVTDAALWEYDKPEIPLETKVDQVRQWFKDQFDHDLVVRDETS